MLDMAMPGEFDLTGTSQTKAAAANSADLGPRLRNLLSFTQTGNPFSNAETDALISAIDNLKALDPACGSGAFPMGLLQKLIHVLHRLDPDNARWKAQNRRPVEDRLAAAKRAPDPSRRESEIEEAEAALAKLDRDFSDANRPDYWAEFDEPKIIVPSISDLPNAARDLSNFHTNNKATIFVTSNQHLPLAVLNSPIGAWFARQTFTTKAGGFLDFEPRYSQTFVVPSCPKPLDALVDVTVRCIEANCDPRIEQLLNGFVYELFFKEDLHDRNLTLFAEAEKAGLGALSGLEGPALLHAAAEFADRVFSPTHPLYAMLFDLRALDVVRIIEGRE